MFEVLVPQHIPTRKIGTPFQSPAWRMEALLAPERFGLSDFASITSNARAGCLHRICSWNAVSTEVIARTPAVIAEIMARLPMHLRILYHQTTVHGKRLQVATGETRVPSWNLKRAAVLADIDRPFYELIHHVAGIQHNEYIAAALRMGTSSEQSVMAKFLGYSFFIGKSDVELWKQWRIHPQQLAWFRLLFFDFSHFPRDAVAKWALIRQLTNVRVFTEVDFGFFRRLHDLGDLALRAGCDFHHLTAEEAAIIDDYLGKTAVINLMQQYAAIRTSDDVLEYNRSIMGMATVRAQKQHQKNMEQMLRVNTLKADQLEAQVPEAKLDGMEQTLVDEIYRRSLVEAPNPSFRSIADIK